MGYSFRGLLMVVDILCNLETIGEETKNPSVLMIEFAQHGEQKSDSYPLRTPESLRDVEQQLKMRYV